MRLTGTALYIHKGSCEYVSVLRAIVELAHLLTRSGSFCHLICSSFISLDSLSRGTLLHVLSLFYILYCVMFNPIAVCVLLCNIRSIHICQDVLSTHYI